MEKSEELSLKREIRQEKIQRIANIKSFNQKLVKGRLYEKNQRVEEFRSQKNLLDNKRQEMKNAINKKKEDYITSFNQLIKKYDIKVRFYLSFRT